MKKKIQYKSNNSSDSNSNIRKSHSYQNPQRSNNQISIFISHATEDAELAEIFSKLLERVSPDICIFRSSDIKGTQGIEYGKEWYPEIMRKLKKSTHIVCLLTENSLHKPWILYEAGVAKGKLNNKKVFGVGLGIPISSVNTGPFAQFQNCKEDEESLTKLIRELLNIKPLTYRKINSFIKEQVKEFITKKNDIFKKCNNFKFIRLLKEFETEIKTINNLPFLNWFCIETLKQSSKAINAIKNQIDFRTKQDFLYFSQIVSEYLDKKKTLFVIALCGKKSEYETITLKYFDQFYKFAGKRKSKYKKNRDDIYVCRIFVEKKGGFEESTKKIIEEHNSQIKYGVIPLIINDSKKKLLEKQYDEMFCKYLEEGVGFLLIGYLSDSFLKFKALIHEKMDEDFSFIQIDDNVNLETILEMFKNLLKHSDEFENQKLTTSGRNLSNKTIIKRVEKLIDRIKFCYPSDSINVN